MATTAQSKTPLDTLITEIDMGIAALVDQVNQINHHMSQARSANVDVATTLRLQDEAAELADRILACQGPLAMLRQAHASVIQMQPLAPVGTANDPMAAASMQQPPMNMPPGMQTMEGM